MSQPSPYLTPTGAAGSYRVAKGSDAAGYQATLANYSTAKPLGGYPLALVDRPWRYADRMVQSGAAPHGPKGFLTRFNTYHLKM